MHKSYKKTIAILITCALISALLCLPVSAFATGGATITFTDAWYVPWGSNGTLGYGTISEREDGYFHHTDLDGILDNNSIIGDVQIFSFSSSNNYGNLVVKYRQSFGSIYNTVYNWLVNADTGDNLNATVSVSGNTITYTYTGYVPSSIRVLTYIYLTGSTSSSLTSFSFTPIDKATQDIIDNQNSNTQAEIEADKENTQSIIDNQNDLAEQEKQEIQDSGNQATDAMDSIPNESEGFINALGTFVSTMSTTDTACSITFPAIKTPSFAGIPAATLSEEKEVDFSTAISLIPSDIMKLIQALTTIALIVFCFKELYDTISEALTRKKANSDG